MRAALLPAILWILLSGSSSALGQVVSATFYTEGKQIKDPCGNNFIPRGINYALLDDWDFPGNMNNGNERSSQIIMANPNIVRIQWYRDYGQASRPAYALADLDSVVSRFARNGVVSVVELHDLTGQYDNQSFRQNILSWWVSADVVAFLERHKAHIILNIANEYGPVMYPPPSYTLNPNYNAQVLTWKGEMQAAIAQLRAAQISVPVMIDACNWGRDYDALIMYGQSWIDNDPLHNVILSVHGYWENENAAQIATRIQAIVSSNLPFVLGETANRGEPCSEQIAVSDILQNCQNSNLGWLAWTWHKDYCTARQMALSGLFSGLSDYGNLIVNNTSFGLTAQARKACMRATAVMDPVLPYQFTVYPNPAKGTVQLRGSWPEGASLDITLTDLAGRVLTGSYRVAGREMSSPVFVLPPGLCAGTYLIRVAADGLVTTQRLSVYE